MCPHTTVYVQRQVDYCVKEPAIILLYMCPHTTIYVSSYYYICVLILLYMFPHTTVYVPSCYCMCVLILLYMCPHTTVYVQWQVWVNEAGTVRLQVLIVRFHFKT